MNVIKCYNYGACEGVNCLYKQLQRLKQENEELKELNAKICKDWEEVIKIYWKTLEEIREIIKHFSKEDIITLPDLSKEQNYRIIAEQYAKPIIEIRNKIDEVLK